MNHPHAGCACPREGHTGGQGRAEDDKTGAGMRQPWRDKVHEVRTRPVYKHSHGSGGFRGMGWDGMDGYGENECTK